MSRPILGVVSIFAVVAVWKDFLWPLLVEPATPDHADRSTSASTQSRTRHAAERDHRRVGHRRDPDDHVLPDLPAQHHVRPDRRRHQRLTAGCASARRTRIAAAVIDRCPHTRRKQVPPCTSRHHAEPSSIAGRATWWRGAAIYQVYLRSFADGNGDGIGDLAGVRARLPYLADLGVDAIWFSPWYPSPMADAGYDVADYRDDRPAVRHPGRGRGADRRGARARHPDHRRHRAQPRLRRAPVVRRGAGRRARARPRGTCSGSGPAAGRHGELPPNNWQSIFGGPAWTRITEPDGTPGEWYLHLFAPEQPDFNWDNPDGPRRSSRTCCGSGSTAGVDGIRIDSAALLAKDPALPDFDPDSPPVPHPYNDRDEVHEIYRAWRAIADELRRAAGADRRGLAARRRAVRPLPAPGRAAHGVQLRLPRLPVGRRPRCARSSTRRWPRTRRSARRPPGCCPTTTSTRHVTRYGRADTAFSLDDRPYRRAQPTCELGTRRARAAALLTLALPGSRLHLPGRGARPVGGRGHPRRAAPGPDLARTGGADPGRDGCRVPLPWSGDEPPFGFSPAGAAARRGCRSRRRGSDLTVAAETGDPDSMLELYRDGAAASAGPSPALGDGPMTWLPSADGVLAFDRGARLRLRRQPVGRTRPAARPHRVLLASGPLTGGLLPPDTAVWLHVPEECESSVTAGQGGSSGATCASWLRPGIGRTACLRPEC